jgi:hypothetical protein
MNLHTQDEDRELLLESQEVFAILEKWLKKSLESTKMDKTDKFMGLCSVVCAFAAELAKSGAVL